MKAAHIHCSYNRRLAVVELNDNLILKIQSALKYFGRQYSNCSTVKNAIFISKSKYEYQVTMNSVWSKRLC